MKQFIVFLSFVIVMVCGFFSCNKDATPPNMGYNYFPDQAGKFIVYDVDSFYYNFANDVDTFKFQLKEKIQSVYADNQGRPTLRLERYIKMYNPAISYSLIPWKLRDIWAENKTKTTAEKVEENVRFIKLAFPVKDAQTWNGNAQNTIGEENYKYEFFDRGRTIGGIYFDSTLQVTQHEEEVLILKKYYIEKYARNIGLVFKQVIKVESQPNPLWAGTPFEADSLAMFFGYSIMDRVTSGFQYKWTINTFGVEP